MSKKNINQQKSAPVRKNLYPSKAYLRFETVVQRSLNLAQARHPLEKILQQAGEEDDLSDMTRASVVLAVAAMDAYFTGVFAEKLVPYLKSKTTPGKDLLKVLSDAGLNTQTALELLGMQRPYRRIRTLMDDYLEREVTQKTNKIDELFKSYGLIGLSENAEKKAKRKNLVTSIEKLVERRHQIVHRGDISPQGKLREIDHKKTYNQVINLVTWVSACDEIIQTKMANLNGASLKRRGL